MPQAIWDGTVLAESDQTVIVEGNHYFPPEAVTLTGYIAFWHGVQVTA